MSSIINKLLYNLAFIPLFYIFSQLIPKDKKLMLLGSGFGNKFMGNTKYFYLWMLDNNKKDSNFLWITRNKKILRQLQEQNFPCVYLFSLKGFWSILRAGKILIEQSGQDIAGTMVLLGRFSIIQTWHGTGLKSLSIDDQIQSGSIYSKIIKFLVRQEQTNYLFYLACSDVVAKDLRQCLKNRRVKVLGYPRNDILFNKYGMKAIKEKLGIGGYKKVFLYAPTFRDHKNTHNPFGAAFLQELNRFLQKSNFCLLIRLHPLSGDLIKLKKYPNIINITNSVDDVQTILPSVDLLISDYSSIIFDYSILQRPIIFYCYDLEDYQKNARKMNYEYKKIIPGPFAYKEDQVFELIRESDKWWREQDYKKNFYIFRQTFNKYFDGKSSERLYKNLPI